MVLSSVLVVVQEEGLSSLLMVSYVYIVVLSIVNKALLWWYISCGVVDMSIVLCEGRRGALISIQKKREGTKVGLQAGGLAWMGLCVVSVVGSQVFWLSLKSGAGLGGQECESFEIFFVADGGWERENQGIHTNSHVQKEICISQHGDNYSLPKIIVM